MILEHIKNIAMPPAHTPVSRYHWSGLSGRGDNRCVQRRLVRANIIDKLPVNDSLYVVAEKANG